MDLPIFDVLAIAAVAFFAAIINGLGGVGGGFILGAALTPVVGAKAVIPLISVFSMFGNLSRLYVYRNSIRWDIAAQFIFASIPGVMIGANILFRLSEDWVLLLLGCVLIIGLPIKRYLKKSQFSPGIKTFLVIGFVFGVVSGTALGSGMLIVSALNNIGLHGAVLLGTDAAIGTVNALSRLTTFVSLGMLPKELIALGVLMGVVTLPGTWVASRLVLRLNTAIHGYLIELILVSAGTFFVVQALLNLMEMEIF